MVTLLFILIAYAIRKKYLPEDATRGDKILYYALSVSMSPLLGPWIFKKLVEEHRSPNDKPSSVVWLYPG